MEATATSVVTATESLGIYMGRISPLWWIDRLMSKDHDLPRDVLCAQHCDVPTPGTRSSLQVSEGLLALGKQMCCCTLGPGLQGSQAARKPPKSCFQDMLQNKSPGPLRTMLSPPDQG